MKSCEVATVPGVLFDMNKGMFHEMAHCIAHDCSSTGGGDGYALRQMMTSHSLVYDCIDWMDHSGLVPGGGCGNVFAYNYSHCVTSGSPGYMLSSYGHHTYYCYLNLWEGNIGPEFIGDSWWGNGGFQTLLRNKFDMVEPNPAIDVGYDQNINCIQICRGNYFYIAAGNVIGDPLNASQLSDPIYYQKIPFIGPETADRAHTANIWKNGYPVNTWEGFNGTTYDAYVDETLVRHGNFDYLTLTEDWDPAIPSHAIPQSLYLASKPSWFGSLAWPGIGPDVSGRYNDNPAKARWEAWVSDGYPADVSLLFTPVA
jgi:hypothetical protein